MSWEELEHQLVGELRVLEQLRRSHVMHHPGSQLEREDPDVQRMIEAMACFSVRTRLSLQRNLQATWRRLFGSYFDFLLAPLPSVGILQAVTSPRLVENLRIERGTAVQVATSSGQLGSFTTLSELRILPIALEGVELKVHEGGSRLLLHFSSRFSRTDDVERLRLHIHCAGHYESALAMHYQLRAHLLRAFVAYDPVSTPSDGSACTVSYGEVHDAPADGDPINPVDAVRRFFSFPERELYMNLQVPRCPRSWRSFTIGLELGPGYVPEPEPARDSFQLFTVPIENRVRMPAGQIVCDGTSAGYPIRHVEPQQRFSLLTVRGVSRLSSDGAVRLRPSVLSTGEGPEGPEGHEGYEVEELIDDAASSHVLNVRAPGALLSPIRLHVDAEWHQPWFARAAVGKLRVHTPHRSLDGVSLQLLSPIRPPHDSPLRRDVQGLLQLLSLRMKPVLSRSELLVILDVLGTVAGGVYRRMPALLRELRVEPALDSALRGSGLRHIYSVSLGSIPPGDEPLVWHFLDQLQRLLDSWNAEAAVELQVDAGGVPFSSPLPLRSP